MLINTENNTVQFDLATLHQAKLAMLNAIKSIRIANKLPLQGYEPVSGNLTEVEQAQESIFDAAMKLGIDLGAQWGIKVDLTR